MGEKLFAVGGYDGSGYLSLVEAYDSRWGFRALKFEKNKLTKFLPGRIAGRRWLP